jgi:gamma-glutamyltranspeptidase / glutathione hydrolase
LPQAVTASSQAAADAGLSILRHGGNAIDAAVATALATCVADPCNTGLGGYGGYLVALSPDGQARCVRFGLWAPSAAEPHTLARPYPDVGPACSAVPNVVGGLSHALREWGTLSWAVVSEPAITLARNGVIANATTLRAFDQSRDRSFMQSCFVFDDTTDASGDRQLVFRQPRLAVTLAHMAEHGPDWFYRGPLGKAACKAWRDAGVDVPLSDWMEQARTVAAVSPASIEIDDMTLYSAPLAITGSACLFGIVVAAKRLAPLTDPAALVELGLSMAALWSYRFGSAGGNDFSNTSVDQWIEHALAHAPAESPRPAATGHTAHLNVLDTSGALVSATMTHGPRWFGGEWEIPGSGVLMNAGMHNFTRSPAVKIDGRYHAVSNMSPTIVKGIRGAELALGCPGARRIPTNIALVIARHAFSAFSLREAAAAGRFHAESQALATLELARLDDTVKRAFALRFAHVAEEGWAQYYGPLSVIRLDQNGTVELVLDDRDLTGFAALDA